MAAAVMAAEKVFISCRELDKGSARKRYFLLKQYFKGVHQYSKL